MPTYERRFYLHLHSNNVEKQIEAREVQGKKSGSNGSRSQSISGNALKHKMKNNLIPNQ